MGVGLVKLSKNHVNQLQAKNYIPDVLALVYSVNQGKYDPS